MARSRVVPLADLTEQREVIAGVQRPARARVAQQLDPARSARLTQQEDNLTLREVTDSLIEFSAAEGKMARATRTVVMTRETVVSIQPGRHASRRGRSDSSRLRRTRRKEHAAARRRKTQ